MPICRVKVRTRVYACGTMTTLLSLAKRKAVFRLRLNYIDSRALRQSLLLKQIGLFASRVYARCTNTCTRKLKRAASLLITKVSKIYARTSKLALISPRTAGGLIKTQQPASIFPEQCLCTLMRIYKPAVEI